MFPEIAECNFEIVSEHMCWLKADVRTYEVNVFTLRTVSGDKLKFKVTFL